MEIEVPTHLLSTVLGIVSGILLLIASANYIIGVTRKVNHPRPLSWFGWTLMMGISLISQAIEKGFVWGQISLALSTLSCLTITFLAIRNKSTKPIDFICFGLGMFCVAIYLVTKDVWKTTTIALTADLLIAIPTFLNAWSHPELEKSNTWYWGMVGWAVGIVGCIGFDIIYFLFPCYLFLFNTTMIILTRHRKTKAST